MALPVRGPLGWLLRQIFAGAGMVAVSAFWIVAILLPRYRGRNYLARDRLEQGLVIVLPGIEGRSWLNRNIVEGLRAGGVPYAIEVHNWTAGRVMLLYNLMALRANRRKAGVLAGRIRQYRQAHPGRPVHIICHSGGGGLAVFALEALGDDGPVESVIILGSALSPTYDLTAALCRTRSGIYNFYSPCDRFYLGAGTALFGTIDRRWCVAAGKAGIREPAGLSDEGRRLYRERLHQVVWDPEMFRLGHSGGHLGWTARRFVRDHLALLIRDPRANLAASGLPGRQER